MRLFVALDPPASVREALAALVADVPGARWTPPEKMHLTLHFLGDVPEAEVSPLDAALAGVEGRAFSLAVGRLGAFPNSRSARVLVAEVSAPSELAALHARIGAALEGLGMATERRPFRPHFTLARLKAPEREAVRAFLVQPVPALSFAVEAFHLYQSRLHPKGAEYTRLRTFALG